MEEEGINLKTCLCFIPLGVAAEEPTQFDVSEKDATSKEAIKTAAAERMTEPSTPLVDKLPDDLRMDEYDDEDEGNSGLNLSVLSNADLDVIAKGDPLVDKSELEKVEDDSSDLKIDPYHDYPIVLGSVESAEDAAVETVIYSRNDSLNYAHHSIITEAYPLALVWLPIYKNLRRKHIIAVASFLPVIEIYNNDMIDQLEPDHCLDSKEIHHKDAVSALSLNPVEQHLLLSASHDKSAIVWDTKTLRPVKHFADLTQGKINAAEWRPDGRSFAVAGESKVLVLVNARSGVHTTIEVDEEVEALVWLDQTTLAMVTHQGSLMCYRYKDEAALDCYAETTVCDGAVLSICKTLESGLIVVGCENGTAHVYDLNSTKSLNKICEKPMQQGPLYDVKASPDIPHLVAFASNDVVVWDLAYEEAVQKAKGISPPS